jgi:hypothetical protein
VFINQSHILADDIDDREKTIKICTAIEFLQEVIENPETLSIDDEFTKVNANTVTLKISFTNSENEEVTYILDIIVHPEETNLG